MKTEVVACDICGGISGEEPIRHISADNLEGTFTYPIPEEPACKITMYFQVFCDKQPHRSYDVHISCLLGQAAINEEQQYGASETD